MEFQIAKKTVFQNLYPFRGKKVHFLLPAIKFGLAYNWHREYSRKFHGLYCYRAAAGGGVSNLITIGRVKGLY